VALANFFKKEFAQSQPKPTMIEFKFSCTNCGQHILANDAYSGRQIICPTCKNQITVPAAPGGSPIKPMAGSPAAPVIRSQTAATKATPPPPVLAPAKKSKTKLLVACSVVALILVGAAAYVFVFRGGSDASDSVVNKTDKKAVEKIASGKKSKPKSEETAKYIQSPSASEIIQKVTEQYDSLTSYSASGTAISLIDMSGVDLKNIPGAPANLPKNSKDSKEFKQAMSKPQRQESDFKIKLGKPDSYLVKWESQKGPVKSKGAVWSCGEGDFLLMEMGKMKYVKMQNRDMALASATGVSGGVAGTIPAIFFKTSSSTLNLFQNATRGDDETVDGVDCYVLNGDALGMKMIFWIDKGTSLIKQKQLILGGESKMPETTDAKIDEGIKQLGGKPTPQQEAQTKAMMKNMKALAAQMKGTMTETYQNIEINKPVTRDDFKHEVPAGTKLSSSLFQ
jgi:DNA-directed RNA polymerase subunit RPC12/RpoP